MKPLKLKLGTLLSVCLALVGLLFVTGLLSSLRSLSESREAVVSSDREIRVVLDLIDAINHTRTARVWLVQAASLTGSGKFEEGKSAIETAEKKLADSRASAKRYLEVASTSDAMEQDLARKYSEAYEAYVEQGVAPLIAGLRSGSVMTYMTTLRDKTAVLDREFEKALDASLSHRESVSKARSESIQREFQRNIYFTVGLGVLFFAMLLAVFVGLKSSVTLPIELVSSEIENIANRNLTQRKLHRSAFELEEIKKMLDCLEEMQLNLRTAISSISDGAESVSSASAEIAAGTTDLSNRTELQAARLEEAAASIQNITARIDQAARAASEAHEAVESAVASAQNGDHQVAEAIENILAIQKASGRIEEINSVINGIAFQTNILALNASVEAARAGDQGRGFAVVASEVRSLANRSAEAAKQISDIIRETTLRVDAGVKVINSTGSAIGETLHEISKVSPLMSEIKSAADYQVQQLGSINESIGELDGMTQQNAALVEQNSAAAESLKQQAIRLNTTVDEFQVA